MRILTAFAAALAFLLPSMALAAPPPNITMTVGVCDPFYPTRCVKPGTDGSVPVTGTFTSTAKATAAAPTWVEGSTTNQISGDLHGAQRFLPMTPTGVAIDLSTPSGVIGADGTTILSNANPLPMQGTAASGATVSGNPLLDGCRAATAAPTAVTDGQAIAAQCGAEGARVTRPYAIKEIMVRGSTGAITNTTQTSIIASAGGSLKNYITAIQCANSGATTSILTFTDAAATILINPAGGGGSWNFPIPLATAAATAFQVTPGSSSTSQYCSAQGYTGL